MGRTLIAILCVAALACSIAVIPVPVGGLAGGPSGSSSGGEGSGGSGEPSAVVTGASSCPARLDAAACPPAPELGRSAAWVGCSFSVCSAPNACSSCNCIAVDGGAAWDCDAGPAEDAGNAGQDNSECVAAGGRCYVGQESCAKPGPQSCGITPAALFCCLDPH